MGSAQAVCSLDLADGPDPSWGGHSSAPSRGSYLATWGGGKGGGVAQAQPGTMERRRLDPTLWGVVERGHGVFS